jgi:NADH-quinone oxidoreductase subunit A
MLSSYGIVGLVALLVLGLALLAAALWRVPSRKVESGGAWRSYRFGFATIALVFLAFDMEMIFMYPWAVVFADIGLTAFLDMLVFIGLLGAGVSYAWTMGAIAWE